MKILFFLVTISITLIYGCAKDEKEDSDDFSKNSGTFIDERDGNEYDWVRIGEQIWMAENLAFLPSVNPISNKSVSALRYHIYRYDGTDITEAKGNANYKIYGVAYNFPASRTACPKGWHLPSDEEWLQLEKYSGMPQEELNKSFNEGWSRGTGQGRLLKATTGWSRLYGFDNYGFRAIPDNYPPTQYMKYEQYAHWWSSTTFLNSDKERIYIRSLYEGSNNIWRGPFNHDDTANIRCIKD
jgi:uncharacterized protein (TIGR02145 family)